MCHAPGMRISGFLQEWIRMGDAQTAPHFEHVHGENEDNSLLDFGVSCSFGGYNSLLLKHDGTGALVTFLSFLALESPDGLGSIYTHETCVKVEALLSEESKDPP